MPQDHSQRLRREAGAETDVRRHDPRRRALAGNQGLPTSSAARSSPTERISIRNTRLALASRQTAQAVHITPNYPATLGLDRLRGSPKAIIGGLSCQSRAAHSGNDLKATHPIGKFPQIKATHWGAPTCFLLGLRLRPVTKRFMYLGKRYLISCCNALKQVGLAHSSTIRASGIWPASSIRKSQH